MILKFLMTLFTAILAFFGLSTPTPTTTITEGHTRPTVGPLTQPAAAEPTDSTTVVTVTPQSGGVTIPEDPNLKTIKATEPTDSAIKLVRTAKKDGRDLLNGREPGDGEGPIPGSALDTTLLPMWPPQRKSPRFTPKTGSPPFEPTPC